MLHLKTAEALLALNYYRLTSLINTSISVILIIACWPWLSIRIIPVWCLYVFLTNHILWIFPTSLLTFSQIEISCLIPYLKHMDLVFISHSTLGTSRCWGLQGVCGFFPLITLCSPIVMRLYYLLHLLPLFCALTERKIRGSCKETRSLLFLYS